MLFSRNTAVIVWALLIVCAIAAEKAAGEAFVLFTGETVVA